MPTIVTSFNEVGYNIYGKRFIETFDHYMPDDFELMVYSEDSDKIDYPTNSLHNVPGYDAFIAEAAKRESMLHPNQYNNYRWQARRFCNKVFAVLEAYEQGPVYWFDADVEFTATPNKETLATIAPHKNGVSILNRMCWPHSEGGFIGIYDLKFLDVWVNLYTSNALFNLKEWHDCMAMDTAIMLSNCRVNNLSGDPTVKHVWPTSPLAKFCQHHKGPGRKVEAYGTLVQSNENVDI